MTAWTSAFLFVCLFVGGGVQDMDRLKRIWYLYIRAVSPEPPLLAHTSSESKGTFGQKARSLARLNGWACAVKTCHDGMLEDTNSLDGARIRNCFNVSEIRLKRHKYLKNTGLIFVFFMTYIRNGHAVGKQSPWHLSFVYTSRKFACSNCNKFRKVDTHLLHCVTSVLTHIPSYAE